MAPVAAMFMAVLSPAPPLPVVLLNMLVATASARIPTRPPISLPLRPLPPNKNPKIPPAGIIDPSSPSQPNVFLNWSTFSFNASSSFWSIALAIRAAAPPRIKANLAIVAAVLTLSLTSDFKPDNRSLISLNVTDGLLSMIASLSTCACS